MGKMTTIYDPKNETLVLTGSGVMTYSMEAPATPSVEPVTITVEKIVEVERLVEVPVEVIREVEVVREVQVEKFVFVDRPVEVIKEIIVERRVEFPVEIIKEITRVIEMPKIVVRYKVPGWAILAMGIELVLIAAALSVK